MIDRPLDTRWPRPLRLRTLTAGDAVAFARHVEVDVDHLREHLPWAEAAAEAPGAAAFIGAYERQDDGRVLAAGAFDGDEIVGGGLLMNHAPGAARVELGCWVSSAAQGRGVAAAACCALIEYARDELRAERVEWHCTTANPRSRALAERLGFAYEDTLPGAYELRGEYYDLDVLSLVGLETDQAGA